MKIIYFLNGLLFGWLGLAAYLHLRQGGDYALKKQLPWLAIVDQQSGNLELKSYSTSKKAELVTTYAMGVTNPLIQKAMQSFSSYHSQGQPPEIPHDKGMDLKRRAMQITTNSPGALLASFISQTESTPRLTLITGPRGAGKTIWCTDLIGRAHARGLNVRGLISPSVFEADQKIGIDLKDLQTGEQRHLAYRKGAAGGDVQTQDWQLVAETLDWGNSVLERIDTCDLFILDELGSFEFEHGVGLVEGIHIIDSLREFPCVVVIRQSLIPLARKRWPWAHLIDVSTEAA